MDDGIYRVLALRVREERRRAGLTLEKLGERAGISGAFVAHIEAGRKRATLGTLAKLARALGIPPARMLDAAPRPGDPDPNLVQIALVLKPLPPRKRRALVELARAAAALAGKAS